MTHGMPLKRSFNIRLWFGLVGLCLVAVICVVCAQLVADFLTRTLLERESEVSQEFFQGVVRVEGDAVFVGQLPESPPNRPLTEFAKHVVSTPGVLRANIYAADRRVIWSTERQLIGRIFPDNPELEVALSGKRVTEINSTESHKSEHVAFAQNGLFIEAYLPIRSTREGNPVIGAVELYKFPTALNATIADGRRMVWVTAVGAASLLYLALFWIVQRGAVQIERQQEQLARLQSFAAIGELASAVAHSLRNPMAAIRSSAELWRSELPPGRTEIADEVMREIDRMDSYVRDLLAYARPQLDTLRTMDPMAIVDAALARRQTVLQRAGITLRREDSRTRRTHVRLDPALFEHAVTSIVDNAVEAMAEGGTLSIRVSIPARGSVAIEISDTGAGMSSDVLSRISEAHFTTKSRGLGLGLALARGVVERWDGTVAIASRPGLGTSVSINLRTV